MAQKEPAKNNPSTNPKPINLVRRFVNTGNWIKE